MSFFAKIKQEAGIDTEPEEVEEPESMPESIEEEQAPEPAPEQQEQEIEPTPIEPEPPGASQTVQRVRLERPKPAAKAKSAQKAGELAVDVYRTPSHFVVQSTIAGIKSADLDVSFDNDMLIISGERQKPAENQEQSYFYQECYWGPFTRKIIFPEEIDISRVEAEMNQGILTVKVPRAPKLKTKKIIIQEV